MGPNPINFKLDSTAKKIVETMFISLYVSSSNMPSREKFMVEHKVKVEKK